MSEEIRVKISDELDKILYEIANEIGTKKTEYVKSLIINDLRGRGIPEKSLKNT